MRPLIFSLAATALVLSGCATPEAERTARACLPDSGFCYFPDGPYGQAGVGSSR